MSTSFSATREVVITRVFDAPRRLVFAAWTTPEHLANWWGPDGFTLPSCTMDFRPGGGYRVCMRSPEGRDYWVGGIFREIVEPERIVFTWAHEDERGVRGHETLLTVTFEDQSGKTKLTLRQGDFDSDVNRDEHESGWMQSLAHLAATLAKAGAQ